VLEGNTKMSDRHRHCATCGTAIWEHEGSLENEHHEEAHVSCVLLESVVGTPECDLTDDPLWIKQRDEEVQKMNKIPVFRAQREDETEPDENKEPEPLPDSEPEEDTKVTA